MAKALQLTGGPKATETARFVDMVDKMFDCLNVNNFTVGIHKRKKFKLPYRSSSDFRLKVGNHCAIIRDLLMLINASIHMQWLEEEFLPYLKEWEDSVARRPGFSKAQMKRMLLSAETLLGIRITGGDIVAVTNMNVA